MVKKYYCGHQASPPSKRHFGSPVQCTSQVRRFGRRMISDAMMEELRAMDVWKDDGSGCGRRGGARMAA